ncbi:hypothetical protein BOX30_09245 [Leptospirillum ferriphilum]|uniref:Helix-turn-helix domain-containing protein n=2 Tax=Leptospirillum ferriphilum TaxID=178606 RepID=J9Z9R2_LEPFM|nr:hypothetical protein LFML04_0413 [Leptospirillum ferriphilum ML-04]OOH77757.1 hypothetical protein BOX30_09245 [Leptospirillum ferriphilum]
MEEKSTRKKNAQKRGERNMEALFTVREAAKLLTLKESTVYRWILDKKIRPVRVGTRAVRIPEGEILRIREEGMGA